VQTSRQSIDLVLQVAATAGLAVWCFLVIQPFLTIIVWATILAIGLHPIFLWLRQSLGQHSAPAAALLAIGGIGLIIGPIAYLAVTLFGDLGRLVDAMAGGRFTVPAVPPWLTDIPIVGESLAETWQAGRSDLGALLQRFQPQLEGLGKFLLGLGANAGLATLQLIVALLVATAFMLKAGPMRARLALVVRRLAPEKGEQLIALATSTLQHVIRGVIGVAVVQSGLIGIALAVAGIPWSGLLSLACFVLVLLQIGPTLIVLPVLIYAWLTMGKVTALLLTLWLIPAGLIDNVLKPIWMARGLPVPLVVVLLGVIGGTLSNGIVGLFTGPVVLALGYDVLRIWARDQASAGEASPSSQSG
jgi:predicted PurR-regulated permease PerM